MSSDAANANRAAMQAMAAGNMRGAQAMLLDALARDRSNLGLWLNRSLGRSLLALPTLWVA